MKIHFLEQEKELMRKYAEQYRKKTGDNYSVFHIMSILCAKYEKNLDKDLKQVMEIKFREHEEEEARKGVNDLTES